MTSEKFTDKKFWSHYWEQLKDVPTVPNSLFYEELVTEDYPKEGARFIEVGGYPGVNSVFFKKKLGYQTTLLDFHLDLDFLHAVEEKNGVPAGSTKVIDSDFFSYEGDAEYDVVFSAGFIEHFDDTLDVLRRHVDLLAPGGKLLVTLPNFRGLNGWVQYFFDRENYRAHNIGSMKLSFLKAVVKQLDLKNVDVFLYGRPVLWLDHSERLPKLLVESIYLFSSVLTRLPLPASRFTSPYIVISGSK